MQMHSWGTNSPTFTPLPLHVKVKIHVAIVDLCELLICMGMKDSLQCGAMRIHLPAFSRGGPSEQIAYPLRKVKANSKAVLTDYDL